MQLVRSPKYGISEITTIMSATLQSGQWCCIDNSDSNSYPQPNCSAINDFASKAVKFFNVTGSFNTKALQQLQHVPTLHWIELISS